MNQVTFMAKLVKGWPYLALRKLAAEHAAEYGSVLRVGGQAWAQLSDSAEPNYMAWALAYFRASSVLIVCQLDDSHLVLAWDKQEALCNQKIGQEHLPNLLGCLQSMEAYSPKVFYFSRDQRVRGFVIEHWAEASELADWPVLLKTIPKLKPVQLQFKQTLSWGVVISVCLLSGLFFWPNESSVEGIPVAPEPAQNHFITLLAEAPGAASPLLELDAQMQSQLYQLPGWEVATVEYRQGLLQYRMLRTTGQVSELRRYAERLHTQLLVQGGDVWLQKQITLPAARADLSDSSQLQPLIHLEDHLNDSIRTLTPTGDPQFQALNVSDSVGVRRAQIRFEGYFHEDLLTLSGLLQGLPIRLIDVNYRVRDHQLHGYVSIDIYGVHNG